MFVKLDSNAFRSSLPPLTWQLVMSSMMLLVIQVSYASTGQMEESHCKSYH